jgi:hypothetical protein
VDTGLAERRRISRDVCGTHNLTTLPQLDTAGSAAPLRYCLNRQTAFTAAGVALNSPHLETE